MAGPLDRHRRRLFPRRVHLGSCLTPFCRFLSHAPCLSGSERGAAGARGRDRAGVAACTLVACRHRPADSAGGGRHDADAAGRAPQLPADRPLPVPARADPAGDQPVLRREQHDGRPFSRNDRSVVYQRAKGELDTLPFGTQRDVYAVGYEWINHSLAPVHPDHDAQPRASSAARRARSRTRRRSSTCRR